MARIAFIGTGRTGRPMLEKLAGAGHDVTVLVRRPEARAAALASGAKHADSIAAVVRNADLVFVVVFSDDQVRAVCSGASGALASMKPGATLLVHTTCDPATMEQLESQGNARSLGVLDAPFSGGPHEIGAGTLTLWIGGPAAAVDALRPLLAAYASPILHVGPVGSGQRVKLVNNALFAAQVTLALDAVRLGGALGIGDQALLAALQHGSSASRALGILARGGVSRATADRLAEWLSKDVETIRDVADRARIDLGLIGEVLSDRS